jgi:1-phosphofructokinase
VRLYGELTVAVRSLGCRVAVDTSGEPLGTALLTGPGVCKPNADELAELVGRRLPALAAVVHAAQQVRSWGLGAVLVSLGATVRSWSTTTAPPMRTRPH